LKSILYLTPKLNHYKFRQLNLLAKHYHIDILSGYNETEIQDSNLRTVNELRIDKSKFSHDKGVRQFLRKYHTNYDFILVPFEKKFLTLIVYAKILKIFSKKSLCLITHNHPVPKSGFGNKIITFIAYNLLYDKVIFYTENSCRWAITERLIPKKKAFWANNTIDETEIIKYKKDRQNPLSPPRLLMIGRLLEYRWIDRLIDYYSELKKIVPTVELHVIGDGPEKYKIEEAQRRISDIHYYGMLIDEMKIGPIFNEVDFVFIPGHSGLSINHSFAYGKPYITSQDYVNQPPEYSYLKDGVNSIILTGNRVTDIEKIGQYITDKEKCAILRNGAIETAKKLSIKNWVKQMHYALDL